MDAEKLMSQIKLFDKKEDCCGCAACIAVCPVGCITMSPDEDGFLYPRIDDDLCTKCGKCKDVCAFQMGYSTDANFDVPQVYAAKHKDNDVLMNSSSGGAFTAVSDVVLDSGGVIFGASIDEDLNVRHEWAENKQDRNKFRGSKYIQSDMRDSFAKVAQFLSDGREVLFSGTPCQTASLRRFLCETQGEDILKNLVLCDLICHGVPNSQLWQEFLKYYKKTKGSKIVKFAHRSKLKAWGVYVVVVVENGNVDYKSYTSQAYMDIFLSNLALRPSCHNCKYTNLNRPSDMTIADYWGIEKYMPDFYDTKGVSLILVNTKKGGKFFEDIKPVLEYRESNVEDCSKYQLNLKHPSEPHPAREQFWREYHERGFEYVFKKYFYNPKIILKSVVKPKIASILRKLGLLGFVKALLKKN